MTADTKRRQLVLAGSLLLMGLPRASWADPVTFTGSDPSGRSASVTFEATGSTLIVTLTNTSPLDTLVPSDLLTAVFFDIPVGIALSPVSATLAAGSTLVNYPLTAPPTTDLSGEWAYHTIGVESRVGISSAGYGLFGPQDRFNTESNLDGPASPDGMNFGIASADDDVDTGNRPLRVVPYIKNEVIFQLLDSFDLDSISNVIFQYGTGLNEPSFSGSKEGGSGPPAS